MKKLTTALITILAIALICLGLWKIPKIISRDTEQPEVVKSLAEPMVSTEEATVETPGEIAEEPDGASEVVAEGTADNSAEASTYEDIRDEDPDIDKDELAYKEDLTTEDVEAFKTFLEEQPDIDENAVEDFFMNHPQFEGYRKDPDGVRMPPLTYNSLQVTDDERPYAAVKAGLQKSKNPIDDAVSYPFNLTDEQVQKILAAGRGAKINFSEEELESWRLELFREFFENPVLFEAWMRLVTSQKIGEDTNLIDHWKAGREYIDLTDTARAEGKGINIWLRKVNGIYYTNKDYQKYVIALIELLWPRETKGEVLTAKAGDHYHLIAGDFSSMRQATPANYEETLASMTFTFYLKNGKVGIRFGANYRDKRPEVLNMTTTSKPKKKTTKKKTSTPKTQTTQPATPQTTPQPASTPEAQPSTPSTPEVEDNTPSNPTPSPKPDNTPEVEDKKEEKHPDEGSGSQGNADTGGGQNDDPGPGPQKPDQGNSQSDNVPDSQYQQGNSESHDDGPHDEGPKADHTDNGDAPDPDPIPVHDTDVGGSNDSAGSDNGAMDEPPVD